MRIESKPIVREFKLKGDPLGEAHVTIRQSKFDATVRRGELQARRRQIIRGQESGEMVIEQDWNFFKTMAQEILLTVVGARGFHLDDDDTELFRFTEREGVPRLDMTDSEFYRALERLDEETVREIHGFVLVMNPQWDPNRAGESSAT